MKLHGDEYSNRFYVWHGDDPDNQEWIGFDDGQEYVDPRLTIEPRTHAEACDKLAFAVENLTGELQRVLVEPLIPIIEDFVQAVEKTKKSKF